jgi:hypothetical protein
MLDLQLSTLRKVFMEQITLINRGIHILQFIVGVIVNPYVVDF